MPSKTIAFIALFAFLGCRQKGNTMLDMEKHRSDIAEASANPSLDPAGQVLHAERFYDGRIGKGKVTLRSLSNRDAGLASHLSLAAVRAWISLGEQYLIDRDWAGATSCARAGLKELGDQYASYDAIDDTDITLHIANDLARKGKQEASARAFMKILSKRAKLYLHRYSSEINE